MGNYLYKTITTHQFPCQLCGTVFQREISGTLLCRECGINNKFDMIIDPNEKRSFLLSYATFPLYIVVKDKSVMYHIENDLKYRYHKFIIEKIKRLSQDPSVGIRYRLIKSILKYLDETNYIHENNLKGLYIKYYRDILSVCTSDIQDEDRILYIDLVGLERKLTRYYEIE